MIGTLAQISQDELREAIAAIQNRQYDKQITIAEAITQTLKLITARDAEREAAIRIDEGKYWENNIMPEFRSWQTSEKMSNRYKALEAIKRKARP